MANRVRHKIRDEVGNATFCILVDEAHDQSKREQMAIILRFVNSDGMLMERFFAIKSVSDTTTLNLKNRISDVLANHNFHVQDMRGQGYDGANNIRGAWNGLQVLFFKDCPYAYYIHCFVHRLQLALVIAAKEVGVVWEFFSHLDNVINVITSFSKCITELQVAQRKEIENLLATGQRESRSGANQIGNLQQAGATRWSSYFSSVKSLIDVYAATCQVLKCLLEHSPNRNCRAEAYGVYGNIASFEFVFVLHLMRTLLGTCDVLCQALQRKAQDILTAMRFLHTIKNVFQELREDGWDEFLKEVKTFCLNNCVEVLELDRSYNIGRSQVHITVEHHYHFDVFNEAINFILMELNTRFNDTSVELLCLSVALDLKNSFESFNMDDICKLVEKFYPQDFTPQDIHSLKIELRHYQHDVMCDP